MGRYCKAYSVKNLREYQGWSEKPGSLRPDESASPRAELSDDNYLFLQENFTVTDGIFLDEYVVFDNVSADWVRFCEESLGFKIPDDLPDPIIITEEAQPSEVTS